LDPVSTVEAAAKLSYHAQFFAITFFTRVSAVHAGGRSVAIASSLNWFEYSEREISVSTPLHVPFIFDHVE
jgi:hypothetical protein